MIVAMLVAAGTIAGKVEAQPAKYLEETVVYLKDAPPPAKPAAHSMDQKGMKFIPHVVTVATGDTVKFLNHDGVDHNVYSPDGEGYNLGMIGKDKTIERKFDKPGAYSQLCSVHPEMLAYIYVSPSEHAVAVGKDGTFTLKDVPAGTWKIAVWNPKLKAADQPVTVADGKPANVSFSIKR
jgi:plastocyanin